MKSDSRAPGLHPLAILLVALSLSIGWGVRGNWGHEYGAMIPGALAAMAACLLSGREDWRRRVAYFAFFGALGWSFGGSISYMQVIGYTHSGHLPSVVYGFACLFLIGFIWGAMGGAGCAMPAVLDFKAMTDFFAPLIAVFAAWTLQDFALGYAFHHSSDREALAKSLNWFDSDWISALTAIGAILFYVAVRRRWTPACSLILHMAVGWWVCFLLFPVMWGMRMTPPRGDNWAGALGMTVLMMIWFARNGMMPLLYASLVTGIVGGFGFSFGQFLKLLEIKLGLIYDIQTNYHSILEQTYGFINGIGVALSLGWLTTRVPLLKGTETRTGAPAPLRHWSQGFSICFILIIVTYVNIQKNFEAIWFKNPAQPKELYGLSAHAWFDMGYVLIALTLAMLLFRQRRRSLSVVPASWLGRGQLLYLVFLGWIVMGNLSRYIPFMPQRLVTEGTIHVNACVCALLIQLCPREKQPTPGISRTGYRRALRVAAIAGFAILLLTTLLQTAAVRAIFGAEQVPQASLHIRFGPNATLDKR